MVPYPATCDVAVIMMAVFPMCTQPVSLIPLETPTLLFMSLPQRPSSPLGLASLLLGFNDPNRFLLFPSPGVFSCFLHYNLWEPQFSSAQSWPTLCSPMDCSMPGLPVHHQLLELAQTHVHWVGDAIQPSLPLLPPSPPAFNLSHHQGLFKWVSSLHQLAKGLEFQLQHQSFQWIFRTDFLWNGLVGSPCSPRDSQESSQHHSSKALILWHSAFFIVQLSHPYMTTGNTIALTRLGISLSPVCNF